MKKYFDEMLKMGWNEADRELLEIHKDKLDDFLRDSESDDIDISIGFLIDFTIAVEKVEKGEE